MCDAERRALPQPHRLPLVRRQRLHELHPLTLETYAIDDPLHDARGGGTGVFTRQVRRGNQHIEVLAACGRVGGVGAIGKAGVKRRIAGRAVGVRLASGEVLKADYVVINADAPTAYRELLPPTPYAKREFRNSCSALMFYIGYTEPLPHQLHHNVYFSRDFEANLRELFVENRVPSDPSFYTCLSNRTDPADAPAGCENLYVLVPVPNLTGEDARAAAPRVLETVIQRVGLKRERMQFVETLTPHEWQAMGLWQGAAFGIAHTFFQSTAFRPSVQTPFRNAYLVGASTQPGNGIPMTLISAELVAQRILGAWGRKA